MNHTDDHHHHHDHDHDDHESMGPIAELVTVRDWVRYAVTRFNRADLHFGHGCSDAFDEALWLVLQYLQLPRNQLEAFLDACILSEERLGIFDLVERRVNERIPMAYLLKEAWMGQARFYVDKRVIVPRSFFGELLENSLEPWIEDPEAITEALDLCTGSGCLAVLLADAFPNAQIAAVDLSDDALAVARHNVADYGLEQRVDLIKSDLFEKLENRKFDLIISNPPYVTAESMENLPAEYRHEPYIALAAGEDGLDVVRRILTEARGHLNPGGILAIEVGHNRAIVEHAFPELPFIWLSTQGGDDMVFMLRTEDLPESAG